MDFTAMRGTVWLGAVVFGLVWFGLDFEALLGGAWSGKVKYGKVWPGLQGEIYGNKRT